MVIWVKTISYFSVGLSLKISDNGVYVRALTCRLIGRPFYSSVLSYLAMNASEAGVELALIQTSLLLFCKSSCSYAN